MDCAFYILDAVGDKFCYTVADESYAPKFRKHAQWFKRESQTKAYRDKVGPYRTPAVPMRVVIEPIVRES